MSNSPISIIFAGTPDFAVPSLEALIADEAFDVQLVISQPDKPIGRKQEIVPTPVKACAVKHGIPVEQPENINNFPLSTFNFQFLVVVAYGQILKKHILDAPIIAPVNLHPSLLPRWRGPSPMKSAILAGDTETGVTIQRIVQAVDSGPILSQVVTPIEPRETILSLQQRLSKLGSKLLVETLKETPTEQPQNDADATKCYKLNRSIGNVDPNNLTAKEVDRHVRALVPWPGVRVQIAGENVKLLKTSLTPLEESIPLQCKDTELHIALLQPPGKTAMTGLAWHRGHA